jgi:hypothetical protein
VRVKIGLPRVKMVRPRVKMSGEDGGGDALWRLVRPSDAPKRAKNGRLGPLIFTHPHPIFTLFFPCFQGHFA